MGYRCQIRSEKAGEENFRMMEVVVVKKGQSGREHAENIVVAVDNQWDTLRYVQEHMDEFVSNIVMVKKMAHRDRKAVEDSAHLFEKGLEPLFSLITSTSGENVMDKLSASLKKALLLMAMDRYECDRDNICQALGISREMLEGELKNCGLEMTKGCGI